MNEHEQYCHGCLKFNEESGQCIAFKELWTTWNSADTKCWSREEDPKKMLDMLNHVDIYVEQGTAPQAPNGWRNQIKELKPRMEQLANAATSKEIEEAFLEDTRRGKGGGGEKNKDGSAFGPQELKDNRFVHRRGQKNEWKDWR